jgi:hypothetical protein
VRQKQKCRGKWALTPAGEAGRGELSEGAGSAAGREGRGRLAEVGMVEEVERVGAELEDRFFRDVGILGDREIDVFKARSRIFAAGLIAEAGARAGENAAAGHAGAADSLRNVLHVVARESVAVTDGAVDVGTGQVGNAIVSEGGVDGEGIASLQGIDVGELPALGQAVALEGQVIDAAQHPAVAHIEVGGSVVAAGVETVLRSPVAGGGQVIGVIVQGLTPGIRRTELQIIAELLVQGSPHRVVVPVADAGAFENVGEGKARINGAVIREREERPIGEVAADWLVLVQIHLQVGALRSDIADLGAQSTGDLLLDQQVVALDLWIFEIVRDGVGSDAFGRHSAGVGILHGEGGTGGGNGD